MKVVVLVWLCRAPLNEPDISEPTAKVQQEISRELCD
jgi:hypothetical protein